MPETLSTPRKGKDQIWDWDIIKALYMGGMELKQIVEVPRFRNLSISYLGKRASEQKWRADRESARAESTGMIGRSLMVKMAEAEEIHQQWLLDKLDYERKMYDKETQSELKGGKNQMERLKIINQLDEVTRRQLGIDERKQLSPQQKNLGILISLQSGGKTSTVQVGIKTLEEPNGEVRATKAELEAAKLLQEYKEQEKMEQDEEKPLPPGIKPLTPFKVKGGDEVTVNEPLESWEQVDNYVNAKHVGPPLVNETEEDIVVTLREAGYDAREISPGAEQ